MLVKTNALKEQFPFNPREIWSSLFLVALVVLAGIVSLGLGSYLMPNQPYLVKPVAEFPPSTTPYHVMVDNVSIWVINTGESWLVFDGQTPALGWRQCNFAWEVPNQRFVDPCSGSKFSLRGDYLSGPASGNLTQYAFAVEAGLLKINLETKAKAN